ncbi:MAG: type II toxin-antitoxin system ParD family antitoxin [Gammaproteobacteria bacterium]|nr:type II toxin-antitoxin system ParD family antitoxin [Gammaproteobacteria bacterium]MBU1725690.1 type II toxin-antitoxin system ParD family antitoxin [Gammaproteobacteria bacterium]MBU2003958.1 type II toxin-antitoxin system ParD family antitoxin [Gammaproteobacteria bacterium]
MSRNTSISLSGNLESFVDRMVSTGHYHSVSEVVRAGLRLLEEQELRLQRLREALLAGEDSGQPQPFDRDAFKREMHAELGNK